MYLEKIKELLEQNMTEKGFKLWSGINKILPDIWNKSTSSTKKYHKKLNGDIPDIAEHVYQMLYAATKVIRLFGIENKSTEGDKIYLAIVLHDSLKYGKFGSQKFTDYKHDKAAADMIASNKDTIMKLLTEEQFFTLEEAVRFHSGRWSTDVEDIEKFSFRDYNPETMFVHMLDMLSTADCLKTDVDYQEGIR